MDFDISLIRERLQAKDVAIGTSDTDAFSSNVPEKAMRNIVAIFLIGDGSASTTVDIKKKGESGSYTVLFNDVPVSPAEIKPIPPQSYNLENPIVVLEGGTNLGLKAASGSPHATVVYWDSEI